MTRLLSILLLVFGISFGTSPVGAGEPFTAPDGTAYPDGVQAVLTEAKATYDAEDFQRAHALWLPLAEAGNAEAQYRVGRLYDVGEGFARNGPTAVKWYSKASDQAHPSATHNLALLYATGELVPKNYQRAVLLYQKNSAANVAGSQGNLGLHYMTGRGVARDFAEAYKWFFVAAENQWQNAEEAISYFSDYVPQKAISEGKKRAQQFFNKHN